MAHTKAGGSTQNLRDSESKRLGVKIHDGMPAKIGNIIIRQRGWKYWPGRGVKTGKDDTIFAVNNGIVKFEKKNLKSFTGARKTKTIVNVV